MVHRSRRLTQFILGVRFAHCFNKPDVLRETLKAGVTAEVVLRGMSSRDA